MNPHPAVPSPLVLAAACLVTAVDAPTAPPVTAPPVTAPPVTAPPAPSSSGPAPSLPGATFIDATAAVGLAGISTARVCFADLNHDHLPDIIADRRRIFLNTLTPDGPRFTEVPSTGLPIPANGDCLVFADLDGDSILDAILTRSLDINNQDFKPPADPAATAWFPGKGDGTFAPARLISAATRATTACIAVGDLNRDGLLDLYLGNWYTAYGSSFEAFPNDLLLASRTADRAISFTRSPLPEDDHPFDPDTDLGPRPTYGALFTSLGILELNYGRRANRLWRDRIDVAPALGLDGDADRSGVYPAGSTRPNEKPFRSHGNTFDATLGDIDNDGDFDLFFAEITHAWAGPSSDRSRFLVNQESQSGTFVSPPALSVDRFDPAAASWNQGDLFAQFADFNHDGRLDLLLSSGEYPDEQRLRLFTQQPSGTFTDTTAHAAFDNVGSQQLSLADVDADGDLDILVGQSFNRMTPEQTKGRTPALKLYLNQTVPPAPSASSAAPTKPGAANSLVLLLSAPPESAVNTSALGAIVECTADLDADPATPPVTQRRELTGIGGHAGKQIGFEIHFGLGRAASADRVIIHWPSLSAPLTTLTSVPVGRHSVVFTPAP